MSDREDAEEFYEKVVEDFNRHIIRQRTPTPEQLAEEDPKVVSLLTRQLQKNALVPFEVALEMIECEYDPMNEEDVDEFYADIVEQYVLDIVKKRKTNPKKNIIKFPKRSVTP